MTDDYILLPQKTNVMPKKKDIPLEINAFSCADFIQFNDIKR